MPRTRFLAALLAVCAGSGALVGCGGDPGSAPPVLDRSPWFQPCHSPEGSSASASRSTPVHSPPPSERLPCLESESRIDLAVPSGTPTVVTVWASWCAPCRAELPAFQRYADRVGDRVRVLGVVSRDTRSAATSLARDLGVRFANLYDAEGRLMRRLGRTALPVTLFIGADGGLVHLYNGTPLTQADLARLAGTHLGVAVAA